MSGPAIVVAGATGNTGLGVVSTLSTLLPSTWRILALTRSASSPAALALAAQRLPGVEVLEKDWTMIDAAWLRSVGARRAFIAPHNGVTQFTDESLFLAAARDAGLEYLVRISTTSSNVGPATSVFYGRNHWAAETLLETPEFGGLKWTSLRPNIFTSALTPPLVAWVQHFKRTGEKTPLKIMVDESAPVAAIDGWEVGAVAGSLLAVGEGEVDAHSGKKYVVVGPSDITGDQMVKLVEKYAGVTVDDKAFRDTSWVEYMAQAGTPRNVLASLSTAPRSMYDGRCSLAQSPTSPEIIKLRAPVNHALEQIDAALAAL